MVSGRGLEGPREHGGDRAFLSDALVRIAGFSANCLGVLERCLWIVTGGCKGDVERGSGFTWSGWRFEDQAVPAVAAALQFLQWIRRGDGAQHVEQRGVGRNLEVEVEETVDKDADAAEERRHGQGTVDGLGPVVQFGPGSTEG